MTTANQGGKGISGAKGKFAFAIDLDDPCNSKTGRPLGNAQEKQIAAIAETRRIIIFGGHAPKVASLEASSECKAVSNMRVAIRSPEAMIFYLGELIRAQSELREPIIARINVFRGTMREAEPLFLVNRGERVVVSVSLDGQTYYVAGDKEVGQSMHLMSLVEQIFALQKKGSELPRIPTVQIIGG